MERYKKKDMLQTVDTLLKANDAIVRTATSNPQGTAEALVQCQESAIALGTYIDTLDERFAPLVHTLEDYCENIYQMSENLSDENLCRKYAKKIQKQLTGLRGGVKYDLPDDKKEVVFLPYKASMWDSLESIWKAADEDPNCDAYVIPIPYFDKNPDGSFREEHYEGDQYPSYVPITRYDAYDFATRRPDAIYIHNPYDECNHVTSVHPYFYCKNLRNYTDKLVYIPYFVLGEIEPDNQEAIDSMKHFCFTPGTIYAHKVVVQSEKMRRIYIKEYRKAALEMGLSGEHIDKDSLERKFLGIGSPKFDKVLNTKKDNLEIPDEWLKVIEKPDGSWKKIIFYNTCVSALLKYEEAMLQKMEYVFRLFKENTDDVALLWRPHPLIQATIEAMRPELWEKYKEIKDRYTEEGWGIYDDTADLDRAVEISDGYYGDPSSVVVLFEKTGKPIMMQDVEILKPKRYDYEIVSAEAICRYQDDYYFVYMQEPFLCRMNRETLECEFLYRFQGERAESRIYKKIIPYQNRLFIVPFYSEQIAVYDITSGEMQFVSLNEDYVDIRWQENQVSVKFEDALQQGKFLYMIPYSYHAIIRMDMESLVLEEIPLGRKGKEIFCYCIGAACLHKNWIVFPIYSESSICFFNIDTNKIDRIYPSGTQKKYSGIFAIGNRLWLIPEKLYKGIDIWDMDRGMLLQTLMLSDEINLMSQKNESMDTKLGFLQEGKLHLLPYGLEYGLVIDVDSGNDRLWNLPYEYEEEKFPSEYSYMYKFRYNSIMHEEGYVVVCGLRGEWTVCERGKAYMLERRSLRSKNLTLALAGVQPGEIMWERGLALDEYITLRDETKTLNKAEKDDVGKIIYEYMSS